MLYKCGIKIPQLVNLLASKFYRLLNFTTMNEFIYKHVINNFGGDRRFLFSLMISLAHSIPVLIHQLFLLYIGQMGYFHDYVTQPGKAPAPALLNQCIRHSLANHCIVMPIFLWIAFPFVADGFVAFSESELPTLTSALLQLTWCVVVEDFLFYWSHRILHHPLLYKRFHKKVKRHEAILCILVLLHNSLYNSRYLFLYAYSAIIILIWPPTTVTKHHEFKILTGTSMASEYTHPVESLLGNIVPVLAGPLLLPAMDCSPVHVITLSWWIVLRMWKTCDAHSGYNFKWSPFGLFFPLNPAERHDYHHEAAMGSFGSFFLIWDVLCGTDADYLAYKKKKASLGAEGRSHQAASATLDKVRSGQTAAKQETGRQQSPRRSTRRKKAYGC